MDDNVPVNVKWLPSNPIPKTLFPNLVVESHSSRSIQGSSLQRTSLARLQEPKELGIAVNAKNQDWEPGNEVSKEDELNCFNFPKAVSRVGLAERVAGRAGFGNLILDTSQIRTTTSFSSPATNIHSPLLTIPPGLSPTTLLDSPIQVSNALVEQSPTMRNAPSLECSNAANLAVGNKTKDNPLEDIDLPSFAFRLPMTDFPNVEKKPTIGINHHQSLSIQGTSIPCPPQLILANGFPETSDTNVNSGDALLDKSMSNAHVGSESSPLVDDPQEGDADFKGELSFFSLGAPSEDGYSWRKYGQKQVKGSEFPRSYYKCTHPICQVKKKVERSHDGHVTEIIYKGVHNHGKPLSNLRSAFPSSHLANELQIDGLEHSGAAGFDWRNDVLEANQSTTTVTEQCDQFNPLQCQDGSCHQTQDRVNVSSTLSNDEEEDDDQVTNGSLSLGCDGDGDETESKRRKLDASALEISAASRSAREPRVVVQTTSEIDILDDGYRWRKYGQKVVKGNPNPRSYYKCTNPGCIVRKHVERASHDLKSVITTYEGKHNHDVPAARTSGGQTSSSATSSISNTAAPPSNLLARKAESYRIPDPLERFDVPVPLGCFGLHTRDQQLGAAGPNFSLAMAQQDLTQRMAMAGLERMASFKVPLRPLFPTYMPPYCQGSGVSFVMPKGVPKQEEATDSGSSISGGSAVYHTLMKMPLGPQL